MHEKIEFPIAGCFYGPVKEKETKIHNYYTPRNQSKFLVQLPIKFDIVKVHRWDGFMDTYTKLQVLGLQLSPIRMCFKNHESVPRCEERKLLKKKLSLSEQR